MGSRLEAKRCPLAAFKFLHHCTRYPVQHAVDVERHARDFMEAAKKLQLYFLGLQHEDRPSKVELLRKDIATMQEELKVKKEMVKKQEQLIQGWRKELKDQLLRHNAELEKV